MSTSSKLRICLLGAFALLAGPLAYATPDNPPSSSSRSVIPSNLARDEVSRSGFAAKKELPGDVLPQPLFVEVSQVIRNWRSLPAAQRHESRMLAEIRADQLRSDYQSIEHVQEIIALGDAFDIAAYRTKSIEYSPQTQRVNVSRAVVHHADGHTSKGEDLGEGAADDPATYDDVERYHFRDLRVGDVIELEYTISPLESQNPYGQYFAEIVAFGGPLRCDLQRYVLIAPSGVRLGNAEHFVDVATVHRTGDQDVYFWEKKEIPALVREARSPSWSEQGPYVHVSNFPTWEDFAAWYADLIKPQFELNDDLRRTVSQIVTQHPNMLDRVQAIDDLVLKGTRYVALEVGVYKFKPYPVTQTFARGFGDCKDKAALMVAVLRAAGIDAEVALLRTRELGEILPQPASASMFDHAIVYVPEFDLWLDGTAEFAGLRELPVADQGVMALTIGLDGQTALRRTPKSSAIDNYSRRTINARLDANGTIHFAGATYVRGEDAPELRRELEPNESKVGYVHDRLAQVLPAVQVHHVEFPDSPAEAVSLSFDGDVTTFRGKRTATIPSSWMKRNYVETLAPTAERTQELRLDAPWTTEEEVHIQLPLGAHVTSLPGNIDLQTPFGEAQIAYRAGADEIIVLSTVQFNQTSIPVSEYSAFRDFTINLEKAFSRSLRVNLP